MGSWIEAYLQTFGLGVFFLLSAVVTAVISADTRTLLPKLGRKLIEYSASSLDEKHSSRFLEEWLAHYDELEEISSRLWHSLSIFFWAAPAIGREFGFNSRNRKCYLAIKRTFDVIVVLITAPAMVVLCCSIAAVVALDGGPIFEYIARRGTGGRIFFEYRFRLRGRDGRALTVIGSILKRYSLYDLPVLLNVLRGEMSLVGPLPVSTTSPEDYCGMKPGVTGLWQMGITRVGNREDTNRKYSREAGLLSDLKILLGTVSVAARTRR